MSERRSGAPLNIPIRPYRASASRAAADFACAAELGPGIPDQQFETILSERRERIERENERVTVERAKAAPEFVAKDLQRPVQRTGLAQNH